MSRVRTGTPAGGGTPAADGTSGADGTSVANGTSADGAAIEIRRSERRTRTVTAYRDRSRGVIVVLVPARMAPTEERRFVDELVAKVLDRERRASDRHSESALSERARRLAALHLGPVIGDPPRPTSVTWVGNQHRRWGSCSVLSGRIRLSTRLQEMPDWVIDYVLLHELVHLVEADHSERFWSLLAAYPQAERARGFLQGWHAARGDPITPDC